MVTHDRARWQDGMLYGLATRITKWCNAVLVLVVSMHNGLWLLARIDDDVHIVDYLAIICFICSASICENLYVVERPIL